MRDRPDPVEIVHAEVPLLVEAAVMAYALAVAALWVIIAATPVVPV